MERAISPEHLTEKDVSRAFAAEHFAKSGADTPLDRALRLDTQVMLVDDPGEAGRQHDDVTGA